jgi:hypothetical protein
MGSREPEPSPVAPGPRFLPSAIQRVLLRATLGDGSDAVQAWRVWRGATDVEALDPESHRLLPLLYSNLRRLGVEDPALVRYASVYKHTWYRNRLMFRALAAVLGRLGEAGIDTMVLKGVVLALRCYPHFGLRPMNDFDVLVPTDHMEAAVSALEAAGWRPAPLPNGRRFAHATASLYHSWGFRGGTRGELDLHWHSSADGCQRDADRAFWSASLPFTVEDQETRALGSTDLLLHTLAHAYASHDPVVRWVADAVMVVRAEGDRIDWDRLVDQTRARHLVLPVRAALAHLSESGLAPIPSGAIDALSLTRPDWMDRAEYAHRQSADPYSLPNKLARLWFWNWRLRGHASPLSAAVGFPAFLRQYAAR